MRRGAAEPYRVILEVFLFQHIIIAAYQTQPVSAITHYAPVARIEPYGEEGKYKLIFSEKAKPIGPIRFGNAPLGAIQGPRYTNFAKLNSAHTLTDLIGKS